MGWVLLFNRAGKYDESDGAPIEGNTKLEITWTDHSPGDWSSPSPSYSMNVNDSLQHLGAQAQIRPRHRYPTLS